jgi:hypothetical protein
MMAVSIARLQHTKSDRYSKNIASPKPCQAILIGWIFRYTAYFKTPPSIVVFCVM